MASAPSSIPRFLLPQSGLIWRRAATRAPIRAPIPAPASSRLFLRLASNSTKQPPASGPRVLAKPERFNPPSHGSRPPKKTPPRHYGGDLSAEETTAQAAREYPGMLPPKNTRAHWFLHNRWIHVVITVGTLTGLAIYTFALSFSRTSPFADMLPPASDYLRHPIASLRMLVEVLRLHEAHKTARISEKRKRNVEDVAKRAAYRKAHGLPDEMGLFGQKMAVINLDGDNEGAKAATATATAVEGGEGKVAVAELEVGGDGGVVREEEHGAKDETARRLTEEERQAVVAKAKGKWLGIF
ncbi:hypothetical protein NEMBOFW57_009848 [Staphylotrichum longicolle]|uniref:Uncharacterized protein n=1 Tax=Staphylotrichum longicolle TaxID=669026 RepID=A0AAD4HV28_9PEZI|nr:hypothetical protein NEMBOFW57_009848 [Staphylotrichum longicolle]